MRGIASVGPIYSVDRGLLLRFLLDTAAATAVAGDPDPASTPEPLVGTWVGLLGDRPVTLELRPAGTFRLAGREGAWSGNGEQLELDDEPLRWRFEAGRLLLTDVAGQTLSWTRQRDG